VLNEDVNFTKQQPTVIFSCVAWNILMGLYEDLDEQQTINDYIFMCYIKYVHVLHENAMSNNQQLVINVLHKNVVELQLMTYDLHTHETFSCFTCEGS